MIVFWIIFVFTLVFVGLGLLEYYLHRRNLSSLTYRIHVNGTRGKSSVSRLIAAGLREGGIVTAAKTTGTLARMIFPDGSEFPVFRPGRTNVIEQVRIAAMAARSRAQALVIECMALQPHLQSLSERRLVRATHGVITNARADHLDVMGPDEENVARALAGMTPHQGKLYVGLTRNLDILREAARDRGVEFISITQEEADLLTDEEMEAFPYVEHRENAALALRVCADLGVAREVALRGMRKARPDPGAMTCHEISFFGRRIIFVNAFAANDPESTEMIWEAARRNFPDVEKNIALFNCRADRQDRSRQLGEIVGSWKRVDHVVLMGSGTFIFGKYAAARGFSSSRIVFAEDQRVDDVFEILLEQFEKSVLVVGMGNIGGLGLDAVRYFKNRGVLIKMKT